MFLILIIVPLFLEFLGGISGSKIGARRGQQNNETSRDLNWAKLDRVFEYMQYLDGRYDGILTTREEILAASSIREGNCREDMTVIMPIPGTTMTKGVCGPRVGICGLDGTYYCGCDLTPDYHPGPYANNDGSAFNLPYSLKVSRTGVMYCFALVGNRFNAFTDREAINLPEISDLKTELSENKFKRKCHERCTAKSLETFYCSDVHKSEKEPGGTYVWWLEVIEYCVCSCPGTGAGLLAHFQGSRSGGPGRPGGGRGDLGWFPKEQHKDWKFAE